MAQNPFIIEKLKSFLLEDIGSADVTTEALSPIREKRFCASMVTRQDCVLAGINFIFELFKILDPETRWKSAPPPEGTVIEKGTKICEICASGDALLKAERTALNLLQHLSGIATLTKKYVTALEGGNTKLLDTRKTTPGLRYFEKYAVRTGGGANHRMGLFDGVIIKDNHIAAVGSITEAIRRVRRILPVTIKIEVETENLNQVEEALQNHADIIMLDNMDSETMKKAIEIINGKAKTEASGGITLESLPLLARLGLDYISTSAIITRAPWIDIGMDITL